MALVFRSTTVQCIVGKVMTHHRSLPVELLRTAAYCTSAIQKFLFKSGYFETKNNNPKTVL